MWVESAYLETEYLTIPQVATSACWHFMADEMKEIYSQFLQTLVEFGVPLKDSSCSSE